MARTRLVAKPVSNAADAASYITSTMVSAGWIVHDDQFAGSSYIIYRNDGSESGDELEMYVGLYYAQTADRLYPKMYTYWNNSTQAGTYELWYSNFSYITTDDDGPMTLWVTADKDSCEIITKIGTTYSWGGFGTFTRLWRTRGTLASGVTDGSDVVLTLDNVDNFYVGKDYNLVANNTNTQERVTVTAKDTTLKQITVNALSQSWPAGTVFGQTPFPYFVSGRQETGYNYWTILDWDDYTTTSVTIDNGNVATMWTPTFTDPDVISNQYALVPLYFSSPQSDAIFGFHDTWFTGWLGDSSYSYEDTIEIGRLDTGTATVSGTGTITCSASSWTTDEWVGKGVIITAGTGIGQFSKIVSNTETVLTLDLPLPITISTDSQFTICDEVWLGFTFNVGYAIRFI